MSKGDGKFNDNYYYNAPNDYGKASMIDMTSPA